MRRRIRDRLFVGAHFPGSLFWALALVGVVWAGVAATQGRWAVAAEGVWGAATLVLLIWVGKHALGWTFWPWN